MKYFEEYSKLRAKNKKSRRDFLKRMCTISIGSGILLKSNSAISKNSVLEKFRIRELYACGHFGNSYEVMGKYEMHNFLKEVVYWGFNGYIDWFDVLDCSNPFVEPTEYRLGYVVWQGKKRNFKSAYSLGLKCGMLLTPNHVYIDQCHPELLAKKGKLPKGEVFGQLICPSIPEARKIILQNHENWFADLKKAGVRLSSLKACPYDYGGCLCDKCAPYILTFAKLMKEIWEIAENYHPGITVSFVGWWWSADDHKIFAEWADRKIKGWAKSIYLYIPYGTTNMVKAVIPQGWETRAFVHIGYGSGRDGKIDDAYGHVGPVIASKRLSQTLTNLKVRQASGFLAYSEGVYEDVNIALLGGLSSGKYENADKILQTYAKKYFGAGVKKSKEWAEWLKIWEYPDEVDAEGAAVELNKLTKVSKFNPWRQRQWELKVELFKLNAAICIGKEWTPERLKLVDKFFQVKEELYRKVWGLGQRRHSLAWESTWWLPWVKSWDKYVSENQTR